MPLHQADQFEIDQGSIHVGGNDMQVVGNNLRFDTSFSDEQLMDVVDGCNFQNPIPKIIVSAELFPDAEQLAQVLMADDPFTFVGEPEDATIAVPVHPVIREILDGGFDLSAAISDQKMNAYIKHLAKMAGIEDKVAIREHRGGVMQVKYTEKYKLVSTHTARRSFATNLLKAKDVPLAAISKALGHSKVTTTMRYLRVGVEENAEILAGSRYFQVLSDDISEP